MRLIVDTLIAAMLVGILAGILLNYRAQAREVDQVRAAQQALARLRDQMLYHKSMEEARSGTINKPIMVCPLWFEGTLPDNPMVPGRQPWMDVAPAHDQELHPPDPILRSPHQAAFWYNPSRAVFRARVCPQFTDEQALALYNKVNGSALQRIPAAQPQRMPRPLELEESLAQGMIPPPDDQADQTMRQRLLARPSLISRPQATP